MTAFVEETGGRRKIAPVARYLGVLGQETLPAELAARLVPLADHPAAFRFLAGRIPDATLAPLLARRAEDLDLCASVIDILAERFIQQAS